MPSDLAALLRRNDPRRWAKPLVPRADADLPFDAATVLRGSLVLLDSTVYIDGLKGRLPAAIAAVLARATIVHSSVARAEIAFSIGRLDPTDARTPKRSAALEELLVRMPENRRIFPSDAAWVEAALLAGILARLQGYDADNRRRTLNDALIFLTARERGAALLTGNVADFDLLSALRPDVKVLLYRP